MDILVRSADGKYWVKAEDQLSMVKRRSNHENWDSFNFRQQTIFHSKLRSKWDARK